MGLDYIHLRHETRSEKCVRGSVNLRGWARILNVGCVHNTNLVRDRHGFLLILRDMYKCGAEVPQDGFELALHGEAQFEVQCAQRFVKHLNIGLNDQCPSQIRALVLAAGKLVRAFQGGTGQPGHTQFFQQFFYGVCAGA